MSPRRKKDETPALVVEVPVTSEAETLIAQAVSNNVPVETLERLLAMRTQIKAEKAHEAFNASMAAFQSACPTIVKTKEVKTRSGQVAYKYAPIESIVAQTKDLIQENGFSYSFKQELKEAGVKLTCVVTHAQGHSEEYSMEVPFGSKTDIMSQSQVAAAASTFAKRYAFCNAFGILTGDEDTDGADMALPTLPTAPSDALQKQKAVIVTLLKSQGLDTSSKEAIETYIQNEFQLALVPENYQQIINLLRY